ncbi:hypothetical protein [Aquimarina sp. Aq107]|uniref:hypothetical protein n=1 Tax=Aquimarina sp. Aq107 TaxID=1191912 RepID=UPI000D560166|nr:hypothetical protein [Aquimarina sp. Aq107]
MKNYLTLVILLFGNLAFSQNLEGIKEEEKTEKAEEISTEFSIPAIPALELISSDATDISRPSNIKKLAASLYNGIDENGNIKQGLAIEVMPTEYLQINIAPDEYRNNRLKYILYNTQLSLGTIATSGDSTNTDLGWGIRFVIFDNSDPMTNQDFINEFEDLMSDCGPQSPTETVTDDEFKKCLKEKEKPIADSFTKEKWNASWMSIAYAGGTRLRGSEVSEGESIGHQVWLSGGFPLKSWGQFSYLAKWSEEYNDETAMMMKELEFGGKFLIGSKSYNLFAEASLKPLLNKDDFESNVMVETDDFFSWTAGIEFKVSNGIWAVAGVGEDVNRIVGSDGIQLLSGLRMGISDKSRLKK